MTDAVLAVDAGVALHDGGGPARGTPTSTWLATKYRHRTRPVVEGVADVMDAFVAPKTS
jgi:hypothetical protein